MQTLKQNSTYGKFCVETSVKIKDIFHSLTDCAVCDFSKWQLKTLWQTFRITYTLRRGKLKAELCVSQQKSKFSWCLVTLHNMWSAAQILVISYKPPHPPETGPPLLSCTSALSGLRRLALLLSLSFQQFIAKERSSWILCVIPGKNFCIMDR